MEISLVGGTGIRVGGSRLRTRLGAGKDSVGEVGNPGYAPFWVQGRRNGREHGSARRQG